MGFGRRRNWRSRDRVEGKKRNVRLIVAIIGSVVVFIGFVFALHGTNTTNIDTVLIGFSLVMVGFLIAFYSLKKKDRKGFVDKVDSIGKIFKEPCHCCKCTNCDRNHNHWTHD